MLPARATSPDYFMNAPLGSESKYTAQHYFQLINARKMASEEIEPK